MSVSKKHLADPRLRTSAVSLYRGSLLTMQGVASKVGISHQTVCRILREEIPPGELVKLKALKYSESKRAEKNPCYGKPSHNRIGQVKDGRGYLTELVHGKRYFVHRIVFARVLGVPVEALPPTLIIHHIDGDRENNDPDNLAATTEVGHRGIHQRYKHSPEELLLGRFTLAEAIRYMTSK
jgi:hypothetical protein